MANEFIKVETKTKTDENGNENGWQELSDQAPEYQPEKAAQDLSTEAHAEQSSNPNPESEKYLSINVLRAADEKRRRRDYNRYNIDHQRDVDRQRRKIEESNMSKSEEQSLRDDINKAFELYFSQLPKTGFFDLDGQPPAEIIYPSEYDDYEKGVDDAAIIPVIMEDDDDEQRIMKLPITFDLTTGLSKEERMEDLIHGDKRGFTDCKYPSAESGVPIRAIDGIPNFIVFLPMPQIDDHDQRIARYKKILDGLNEPGESLEDISDKSRLEEFLDSMSRGELPSQEIQDLFNYQISKLANLYRRRWNYEVKRLSSINQDNAWLNRAKRNRDFFGNIGVYFDERMSGENRRERLDYLRARNPSVFEFFDAITDFLRDSEKDLTVSSYSASPDGI